MTHYTNINALPEENCTGCGMCTVACPSECISLQLNNYGFYVSNIDEEKCNNCGLCIEVCYKFMPHDTDMKSSPFERSKVLAATDMDEDELSKVSSGGVANRLATHFYKRGYNVCGVSFDSEFESCRHIIINDLTDASKIKNSKYLQSYTVDAFKTLNLKSKNVIFGTPCQIYAWRKYIQKYSVEDNFLLIDFFCRGVPSVNLWRAYKDYISRTYDMNNFKEVNFRDKSLGWHKFSMRIKDFNSKEYLESVYDDLFYSFFLKNACFSLPCYSCRLRKDAIYSDIRLGDFWGEKFYNNDKGVSLVTILNNRGNTAWEEVSDYFDVQVCESSDIDNSQRFNKYPLPMEYSELLSELGNGEKLEVIHSKFGFDKQMFYKEKK